jgi:hypothetical protein
VPPRLLTNAVAVLLLQRVSVPLVPAFGNKLSVTVTVAEAFAQGATPITV